MPVQEGTGHKGALGMQNDDAKALQFMWLQEGPGRDMESWDVPSPRARCPSTHLALLMK